VALEREEPGREGEELVLGGILSFQVSTREKMRGQEEKVRRKEGGAVTSWEGFFLV